MGKSRSALSPSDIRGLSFPEATFDAVFGHSIVMPVRDPIPALREVCRVVKPGGVGGFRELDCSGSLYEPPAFAWQEFWELYARVVEHNGGSVQVGKRLGSLLRRAGLAGRKAAQRHNVTAAAAWREA
jgi:ubiquinone/menaquinone biosynthesis C-methylase UbiE